MQDEGARPDRRSIGGRASFRVLIKLGGCLLVAGAPAACSAGNDTQKKQPSGAVTMQTVKSKDGTVIAYDRRGSGPPVILVNGALSARASGVPIAERLASQFQVYTYDRRGRADSGDTKPFAVEREIDDLQALIDSAGGTAYVVGFSSGAALALEAASALGPKISKLVLYEPPYDESEGAAAKWNLYAAEQLDLLAAGRHGEAVVHHLRFAGVPEPAIAQMIASPTWADMESMAPTLPYDVAAIGQRRSIPVERAAKVSANVLVLDGGDNRETMPFMRASADKIAKAVPNASRSTLEGQGHSPGPDAFAPVVINFLKGSSPQD